MHTILDPRTEQPVGTVPLLAADEVGRVALDAVRAFGSWSRVPVAERCARVGRTGDLLAGRPAGLGERFARETGKSLAEAETELDRAVETFRWAARAVPDAAGARRLPAGDRTDREVTVDPAGPVLAVVPSNFPAVVLARKIGPALAMGCSVVVKAPETAPSVVEAIAALAVEAGVPADAVRVVATDAPTAGALVARPEFRVITFTGSTRTGRLVAAGAAATLAACVLELGGHAPAVVTADADLDTAVAALVRAKFASAGQSCAAPGRFLVHVDVLEEFVRRFAAAVPALDTARLDDGTPGTMGPLHTQGRRAEVHGLVLDAVARGARVVVGGHLPATPGFYYPATVLRDVPPDARVLAEEPFGPVAAITGYVDDDEAVRAANATAYGLGAFVFGEPARARALAARLDAGRVSVNCATGADPFSPLSGRGDSGYGYEGGTEGVLAFGRLKVLQQPLATPGEPRDEPLERTEASWSLTR